MLAKLYDALSEALAVNGMDMPEIGAGRFTRFPGPGRGSSDKSSWLLCHEDGMGATFGNFREMIDVTVRAEDTRNQDPAQAAHAKRMVEEAKRRRQFEMQIAWEDAAKRADFIWRNTTPLPHDYPYLLEKFLPAMGVRLHKGQIMVVPVYSFEGRLQTLQFINTDGEKRFLKEGKMEGGLYRFGEPEESGQAHVIYGEGWATMATAHLMTNTCCVAAFHTGNLLTTAESLRGYFPDGDILCLTDNDQFTEGNPGVTKGVESAMAIKARYHIPTFPLGQRGTDFNDLYTHILKNDPASQEIWQERASQGDYNWVFD